tara:strand:+ start:649 stop:1080 length:432 start_codon:yes stop_codon:yes gene_type:complete
MAYVYFIRAGIYTKIGVAKNIQRRMEQLQTGNPLELRLTCSIQMPSIKSAFHFEKLLHDELMDKHKHGEWFFIKEAKVKNIISKFSENHDLFDAKFGNSLFKKRDTEKLKKMRCKLKAVESELSRLRSENGKMKRILRESDLG